MPWAPQTHRRPDQAAGPRQRPSARQRGYDADWEHVRAAVIKAHPVCSAPGCGSRHRLNVDHIRTVREAPHLRLDPANLQVLCQSCHSARTSREHSWNR